MSDFDKEAERERLREKYEKDQAEREATQRMSDLLLKGARMTNTHCNTCGDPLFQMNGTTFCPTCHGGPGAVEGTDLEGAESEDVGTGGGAAQADASGGATPANADSGRANADARQSNAGTAGTNANRADAGREAVDAGDAGDATGSDAAPASSDDATNLSARASAGANDDAPNAPAREPGETPSTSRAPAAPEGGDLAAARDSLRRALERFAREAAETDDPRYATDCLEAAREAADALAALRRGS